MADSKIDDGVVKAANVPVFDLLIRWSPSGQIQVVWPPIDDVAKLGMLEMAKVVLSEARVKAGLSQKVDSPLVIPSARMPQG